jgi:hypothetical protein
VIAAFNRHPGHEKINGCRANTARVIGCAEKVLV